MFTKVKADNKVKVYNVKLVSEEQGLNTTIQVRNDEYIYEAAEQQGIELPISCHAGACVTCAARILNGSVDQDHDFLKAHELQAGFVLTCKAYPTSDCTIATHQQDELLDL